MKAGKLDRRIQIERVTTIVSYTGAPLETWAPLATMRAEVVQAATDDTVTASGAVTETNVTFRTRYLAGLTIADRISYEDEPYSIKRLVEIGRRRGWEISAERLGP